MICIMDATRRCIDVLAMRELLLWILLLLEEGMVPRQLFGLVFIGSAVGWGVCSEGGLVKLFLYNGDGDGIVRGINY